MSSDLVKYEPGTLALVTQVRHSEPVQFIKDALEGATATPFTLGQVRVPSGGGRNWELEGLSGPVSTPKLEVVLCALRGNLRKWYATPFGDGEAGPPDCASHDGISGFGINELEPEEGTSPSPHDCATCPWGQWGSSRKGGEGSKAKDCSDYSLASILQLDALIPDTLSVPPSSLKPMQNYVMRLLRAGKTPWTVVTSLGLKQEQEGALKWSVIEPTFVRDLTEAEMERMAPVTAHLRGWLAHSVIGR